MHQSHRAVNGPHQAINPWKAARIILACCSITFALLVFGACNLPLTPSNAGRLPTATVAPTSPATPTSTQIQAALKTNQATLTAAMEIAKSGKVFDGSNPAFLDANGHVIKPGTINNGYIMNAQYVGQLVTVDQLEHPDTSQPDFLFAAYDAHGQVIFLNIQTYSQERDGEVFAQLQKNNKDGTINVSDLQFVFSDHKYDPQQTDGISSDAYTPITALSAALGLAEGHLYNIALPDSTLEKAKKLDPSNQYHNRFVEYVSAYLLGPVSDSVDTTIQTMNQLEGQSYSGKTALLTISDLESLQSSVEAGIIPVTQTTVAPITMGQGN